MANVVCHFCTGDGNSSDPEPDPAPVVVVSLNDHAVHTALALPGATVGRHPTDTHESSMIFAAHFLEAACARAQLRYANHAVVKDPQPPVQYHRNILHRLTEKQFQRLSDALMDMFTNRTPGIGLWSQAVEAAQLNPLGHVFVFHCGGAEELRNLHLRGAFRP